jgi:hypothetical protein
MQYMDVLTRSIGSSVGATKTEAKNQALSWLASQLRWERTLDHLRDDDHEDEVTPRAA